jgi:hypothetical protein
MLSVMLLTIIFDETKIPIKLARQYLKKNIASCFGMITVFFFYNYLLEHNQKFIWSFK